MRHTGIVLTTTGYRAFIRIHGRLYSRRFPPGTGLRVMQDWRAAKRTDVLRDHLRARETAPTPGTFADDVQTYLKAVATMPSYTDRAAHMALWVAHFGARPSAAITAAEVRAVLEGWRQTLSASTCNKRRTALMHCFTVLHGKSGRNVARDVPKYTEPEPEPRGYPYPVLTAILDAMQPSKTRARLKVLAWTGMSPAGLKRVQPDDLEGAVWFRRRRQKGKGTRGRAIPLLPQAVAAFQELAALNGFGAFDSSALNRRWLHAVRAFIAAQRRRVPTFALPIYTVKDLRHSFGTRAYTVTGDLRVAGELLDHSTLDLTKRYTLKAVDARLETAVAAMAASFGRQSVSTKVTTVKKRQSRP